MPSTVERVACPCGSPFLQSAMGDAGTIDWTGLCPGCVTLTQADREILARLSAGDTVVVRLPGLYQPYPPLLRRLADERRLVRIGRGTVWGNPHRLPARATAEQRAAVIARYAEDLDRRPDLLARLPELRGRALACYCSPLACHGDVLAARAAQLSTSPPSR
ncbi:DUF4326 domain-containing protein [Frankia sp. R82]|uniref:DUF4326 domain-containing protein n=1 Tax=Frankia sp. R82 TaxID=2950553 RepID=UPI002042F728|nr:DUF4326 domain-containing protein [Frankia sp. R82]MCM3884148.1 DUF4326 domain-containing protein [Frankia sp. R82]